MKRDWSLELLNSSAFDRHKSHFKPGYRSWLQQRSSALQELVRSVDTNGREINHGPVASRKAQWWSIEKTEVVFVGPGLFLYSTC